MNSNPVMIALLVAVAFSSCIKSNNNSQNTVPPDPTGTVNYNLTFYPQAANIDTCDCQVYYSGNPLHASGVTHGTLQLILNSSLNLSMNPAVGGAGGCSGTYLIASMGAVSGLGDITTRPSGGYTSSVSASKGQGYVIQSTDYDPVTYQLNRVRYYRFYISDYILSTSGGVLGVYIKYEGPF